MKLSKTTSAKEKKGGNKKPSAAMTRLLLKSNLHELFWCEKQLAELLPEFSRLATSYELASAILAHLAVTENQIIRLMHVFDVIDEKAVGNESEVISNITGSIDFLNFESGFERDSKIIQICQQIMEYEIKTYTLLQAYTQTLGEELAGEFLATAVKEEKNTQRRLNEISLSAIYFDVAS